VSAGHLVGKFSRAFDVLSEAGNTILVFGAVSAKRTFVPLLEERQFPCAVEIEALLVENLRSSQELLAFSPEIFGFSFT